MARKSTTTTVVHSEKDSDGNWHEFAKTVTTVVERDDDGYPWGPLPYPGLKSLSAHYLYGDFLRSRSKPKNDDQEGRQDG